MLGIIERPYALRGVGNGSEIQRNPLSGAPVTDARRVYSPEEVVAEEMEHRGLEVAAFAPRPLLLTDEEVEILTRARTNEKQEIEGVNSNIQRMIARPSATQTPVDLVLWLRNEANFYHSGR